MTLYWYLIGLFIIELVGIIGAAIGAYRLRDRFFLMGIFIMYIPPVVLLIYIPEI